MNLRPPLRFLGRLTLLVAAAQLAPLLTSLFYQEWETSGAFAASIAITAAIGAALGCGIKGEGELYRREGLLIIVGGWILASIFGALPYMLTAR